MSCSMTSTARSRATAPAGAGGPLGLLVGHARHRLVHQQQLGVLHHDHADLEPLLLAVGEPARPLRRRGRRDRWSRGSRRPGVRWAPSSRARRVASTPLLGRASDSSRFSRTRQVREDGRRLELAPDPEAGDLVLPQPDQLGVLAEDHAARRRLHLARDHVEQRGLARSVGPDHHAQLLVVHEEVQLVERLEAVEVDGDVLRGR